MIKRVHISKGGMAFCRLLNGYPQGEDSVQDDEIERVTCPDCLRAHRGEAPTLRKVLRKLSEETDEALHLVHFLDIPISDRSAEDIRGWIMFLSGTVHGAARR